MSSTTDILIKNLAETIVENQNKKPSAYDTQAEVRRIEGNTAWVHIPGGVDETPVQLTTNAKKGDIVQVRVSGGQAWLYGNATAPPTDDTKANAAQKTASVADEHATNAVTSAMLAQQFAKEAMDDAQTAHSAAIVATQSAEIAETKATEAKESATEAAEAATTAVNSANTALNQLSIIEDVAGTVSWIQEHGSYVATTDTYPHEGSVYFIYDSQSGDYVPVVSYYRETSDTTPQQGKTYYTYDLATATYIQFTGSEFEDDVVYYERLNPYSEGWYILDISDSQSEYIMSHIAVTARGLWVLPDGMASGTTPESGETQTDSDARQANNYKVLLSSSGMIVYDEYGVAVASYGGFGIGFDSNRQFTIGDSNAYIQFDGNGHINIGGSGVAIGSSVTIGALFDYPTITQMNTAIEDAKEITTDIKRGNRVTINYETSDYPAMDITADIDPIQSNLYDSVWVEGCSKNLIDRTAFVGSSGVTITHGRASGSAAISSPDGYNYYSDFAVDGTSTYQNAKIGDSSNLLFAPGKYYIKYYIASNHISPATTVKIGFANSSDEFKGPNTTNIQAYNVKTSITITEPCYFIVRLNGDQADGSGTLRLVNLIVSKTDVEYRPYTSNICQITGNDSTDIYLTGENLFGSVANTMFPLYIPAGTEVTASYESNAYRFKYYNRLKQTINSWSSFSKDTDTNRWYRTYELVDTSGNATDDIYYVSFTTNPTPGTVTKPQIKFGTGIEYTPFGDTYTYQFGRTIYKGQISGTSGILKQTHALVDLGDFDYTYDSTYDYFYTTDITDQLKGAELMSSTYMYGGNKTDAEMADAENGTICNDTETDSIKIKDKRFTDAVEFKAAVAGYQLLYELSAYNTYKLVSHSMNLKKGINHIWSSTGQVHVKYAVMTEEAEEALAAPISESARIATNYITYIDSTNGIKVHDVNDFTDYLQMNASKIALYRNNTEKMQLTDSNFRLGDTSDYINIDSSGFQVYKGGNSTALFESTIRLGTATGNNVFINSDGLYIRKGTDEKSIFEDKKIWLGIDPSISATSSDPPYKEYDMDFALGSLTIPPSTTYPNGAWGMMSRLYTRLREYLDGSGNTDYYTALTRLSNGVLINDEATIELIPGSGAYYSRLTLESNKSEWYHSALKVNARLISFEDIMDLRVNDYNIVNTANNYSALSDLYYHGSGYLTTSNTEILITIPMDRPIAASTVSIPYSPTLITRQNNAYTHGSAASTRVAWTVNSATITRAGIQLSLKRTTTTNSVNNSPIGVNIYIQRISFS